MVGVSHSVHFAFYRGKAAGTEDVVNANTQRTFLNGVSHFAKTALEEAVAQPELHLPIHIRQRYSIKVAHYHHWIWRLTDASFHLASLLVAQFACVLQLLHQTTILDFGHAQCVELQIFSHQSVALQMVDDEPYGLVSDLHIALAADVRLRFVSNGVFVRQWVAREDHVAKLSVAVVALEVVVGIGIIAHRLAQGGQGQS